ncbi:hypothetical protein GCM10010991_28450 [Gemmobacter aquaticus]|uniref:Uncharacterized protein n=1 Tax=Gemmobacter aquaticus TaxID=490185 RepID=A0A917YMB2_9RHOB|nr:hypothetical protein GCM10010991_28450 [Gemmobacter aquaticus]
MRVGQPRRGQPFGQEVQPDQTRIEIDPGDQQDIGVKLADHLDCGGDLPVLAPVKMIDQQSRPTARQPCIPGGQSKRIGPCRRDRQQDQAGK